MRAEGQELVVTWAVRFSYFVPLNGDSDLGSEHRQAEG